MGGKGGQTIGYHYLFDILFGLSRGPLNEITEIKVGDKTAWQGSVSDNSMQAITVPNLFGGKKKEGGIQGPFRLFMGAEDQVLPGSASINVGGGSPYGGNQKLANVKTMIGGRVSDMRGTAMLWFSGLISSMNPYPKEWKFRGNRQTAGWWQDAPWYPDKALIHMNDGRVAAMNPAHIIYECLTNPLWGRGLSPNQIDENSFIYSANKLCAENFGLCFIWQRKEEVDQFIQIVIDHIAAALPTDPETGKMVLRLIRDDYVVDDLPLFTPTTGLLDITDDDSGSQDEIFNEVIGTGRDPVTNEDFVVRVHNLAARQSQESSNPIDKQYGGIPTHDLMSRVLQRDLKIHASGLKKFTVILDQSGWKTRPGSVIRIQDTRRGLGDLVLRVGEISEQSFKDGRITLKTVQDVFGLPATSYVKPVDSTWLPPALYAEPATETLLIEANYRDVVRATNADTAEGLEIGKALIGVLSVSPDPVMFQYDLATRAEGEPEFNDDMLGSFAGAATLVDDIEPLQTEFDITGVTNFDSIVDQMLLLANADGTLQEQIGVTAFDEGTGTITAIRGAGDTIPQPWPAATTLWTLDDDASSDGRQYEVGETVEVKVLTRTSADILDEDLAPTLSIELVGRQEFPYPPGDVQVDGDSIFSLTDTYPEPTITWTDRDRLLQEDQIVGHVEASVGPEDGVTYNIRVYPSGDLVTPLRSEVATSPWQYDSTMQGDDGDPSSVDIELESERDSHVSYQKYRFNVPLVAAEDLPDLVTFDFENDIYLIGETPVTFDDLAELGDFGPFDPADIVDGVGLVAQTVGTYKDSYIHLTPAAIDAIMPVSYSTGFSVIVDLEFNPDSVDAAGDFQVQVQDEDNGYAYETYIYWQESFPADSYIADFNNQFVDLLLEHGGPVKFGATLAPTGLLATFDGDASTEAPPPLDDITEANVVWFKISAYRDDPNESQTIIKRIVFKAPMNAVSLEAAATP